MRIVYPSLALLIVCLGLLGPGCTAPRAYSLPDPSHPSDALLMAPTMADPIEPVNRASFALNEFLFAVPAPLHLPCNKLLTNRNG